jgi:hypothetical protein
MNKLICRVRVPAKTHEGSVDIFTTVDNFFTTAAGILGKLQRSRPRQECPTSMI